MKIILEVESNVAILFIRMLQHIDPTNFTFTDVLKDLDKQIATQLEAEKVEKAAKETKPSK